MDPRVQFFGSPDTESLGKHSAHNASPSKRQKVRPSQAAASRQASPTAADRPPAHGPPASQAAAGELHPARPPVHTQSAQARSHQGARPSTEAECGQVLAQPPSAVLQGAHERSAKDSRSSNDSERGKPSGGQIKNANGRNGKAASPKQRKGIKKWFCACFGDAPTSAGQQTSGQPLVRHRSPASQVQAKLTPMSLQPGRTITMQPGHHHLYVHDAVGVSFSDAAPHMGRRAVVEPHQPQEEAQPLMAPANVQQDSLQAHKLLLQPGPSLQDPEPARHGMPIAPIPNGMQMGLRTPLPRVRTRMPPPVPTVQPSPHQPALPEGWATGSMPPPLIRQGGLQASDELPGFEQIIPGSLSMQNGVGDHPPNLPGSSQQPQESVSRGYGTLDPNILKSQRDQIIGNSALDVPAYRTLHSLEDSLSGLLESHQSITTNSSGHRQGGNRIMSSVMTLSNVSGTVSRGHVRTPTPESLLSTKDIVLDRDSKLLSADWTCDLFSSAPELGREMHGPVPNFEFWAPSATRPPQYEAIGRNVLFSDHTHKEICVPKAPQTPAPIGSSMQRAQHTHSMQPGHSTPFAFTAQRGSPHGAVARPAQDALHGTLAEARGGDMNKGSGMPGSGFYWGPRPPGMQNIGRNLMATMPHERLAPYAQRQNPYSNAMAMRNGRASGVKAGPQRLGRRALRAAAPRADARRSYEPQASRPSTTVPTQGVDGSELHSALEALLKRPASQNAAPVPEDSTGRSDNGGHPSMRAKRELMDSGIRKEVVSLLQHPGRSPPIRHRSPSRDWCTPMSSRVEAREMRQEDMQALYRKQQILVEEAAQVAAELEADQAASVETSEVAASQAGSSEAQQAAIRRDMQSSPNIALQAQQAASKPNYPPSSAEAVTSTQWWAFPG